jgi:hypothetical protein
MESVTYGNGDPRPLQVCRYWVGMSHALPAWTAAALTDLACALRDPTRRPRAERWLASWTASTTTSGPVMLTVTADGARFRIGDGDWRDLGRRRVQRRLLLRLTREPGPVSASQLMASGWPGERVQPTSARNRLHVALSRLRRAGLGELLEFDGFAWRLRAGVVVDSAG